MHKSERPVVSIIVCLILYSSLTFGQEGILDQYVKQGLTENLALQQKKASYQKSLYALREAKSLFFPEISFQARYSIAQGGRVIDLPVGDMLNGVYSTLNALTALHSMKDPETGLPIRFPQIDNEEIHFLRPTEHDTKFRLTQPVFNTNIWYNAKIQKQFTEIEKYDIETYKRELIAEMKQAYFNVLKTNKLLEIIEKNKEIIQEHIRVTERLFQNDKVTKDKVYMAKTELDKIEQKGAEIIKEQKSAKAYFNFLLNRDLEEEILTDTISGLQFMPGSIEEAGTKAIASREEIKKLQTYNQITNLSLKMNKANKLPTINSVIDYGFQGKNYHFSGEHDYFLASVMLKWPLFHGYHNKHKLRKAKIEQELTQIKLEELKNKIHLQVINAWYAVEAAKKAVKAAKSEAKSSKKAFKYVHERFKEGMVNMLEYLDARNSKMNAELNRVIAEYNLYIAMNNYEKVVGLEKE